jgi:hypothetical protein
MRRLSVASLTVAAIAAVAMLFGPTLLLAAICLLGIPPGFVYVSKRFFPGDPQCDSLKALLSSVAVGVAMFWVLQGALSSRLQLSADAYAFQSGTTGHKLIVASVKVSNEGSNDVGVESAKLYIIPKRNGKVVPGTAIVETKELRLGPNRKDGWALILKDEYCLAWGTSVTAQVSRILPEAENYDLEFEAYTRHKITGALATWRTSAVVAFGESAGRSPWPTSTAEGKDKKGSVLEQVIGVFKTD